MGEQNPAKKPEKKDSDFPENMEQLEIKLILEDAKLKKEYKAMMLQSFKNRQKTLRQEWSQLKGLDKDADKDEDEDEEVGKDEFDV